jgi:hypothetical protein
MFKLRIMSCADCICLWMNIWDCSIMRIQLQIMVVINFNLFLELDLVFQSCVGWSEIWFKYLNHSNFHQNGKYMSYFPLKNEYQPSLNLLLVVKILFLSSIFVAGTKGTVNQALWNKFWMNVTDILFALTISN